jgi:hypothetical protein
MRELSENPSASPITLNVRLLDSLQSFFGLEFAATSSGDQTLTTADRWFVTRLPNGWCSCRPKRSTALPPPIAR